MSMLNLIKNIFSKHKTVYAERPSYVPLIEHLGHSYYTNDILSHNTTTTASYFVWYLLFHCDKRAMCVANKGRTGVEILGKIKEVIEDLPFFLKPGIVNLSSTKVKFENGCVLMTAAASKSPATGDSINLLYVDEAALIPANVIDEYWASIYPTLSSFRGSLIIMSSTPRGKGNLFYRMYMDGYMQVNGWTSSRVDWWEVPGRDEKWCEQQKLDLGEDLFKREVELSFESAGNRLATGRSILFMDKIKQEFISRDFYSVPEEITRNLYWAKDFDPTFMTYHLLKNKRFLLSIDLAQGKEAGASGKKDADYNVINIFEIELMSPHKIEENRNNQTIDLMDCILFKQIGLYVDNFKDEEMCAEAAKYITFQILKCGYEDIDNTKILVEMNFNGNNWLNKFKTHPSFYSGVILKTPNGTALPGEPLKMMYGYKTKGGLHGKNYYCERGAEMIHKRQIILRQYVEDEKKSGISTITQMEQFGKNEKGVYMGICCHDDIAVTCLFISIAMESKTFFTWVEGWVDEMTLTPKVKKIRMMLDMYVEKETLMSDEMMKAFYRTAGESFNKMNYLSQGYGEIMRGNIDNINSITQGFGNIQTRLK